MAFVRNNETVAPATSHTVGGAQTIQRAPAGAKTGGCALPKTLTEAVRLAEQSEFLRRMLPARLLDAYLDRKRRDAAAWAAAPDPHWYEMQTYFDRV